MSDPAEVIREALNADWPDVDVAAANAALDTLVAERDGLKDALNRMRGEDYASQANDLGHMLREVEAERDELRAALERIANGSWVRRTGDWASIVARAALHPTEYPAKKNVSVEFDLHPTEEDGVTGSDAYGGTMGTPGEVRPLDASAD